MRMSKKSVAMPMTGAGIIGLGGEKELSGIKIDPKIIIGVSILLILTIKILDKLFIK